MVHLRLLGELTAVLCPETCLTQFCAPAGFGKTTLVVDWLKQIDLPAAWLSLDEANNNLPRLLTNLATTIQLAAEHIGTPLLSTR